MAATIFFGFLFGFVGSIPVAGPIAVLVFARSAAGRFRDGVLIAAGASVGEGLYAGFAYWGAAAVLEAHPSIEPISKGLATVLLVALGVYLAMGRSGHGHGHEHKPSKRAAGSSFLLGFTISALNPTLLATWALALTTLMSKTDWITFSPSYAPVFGLACMVGIVTWFAIVITLIRKNHQRFSEGAMRKVVQGMGFVLIGLGVYFGYDFVVWFVTPLIPAETHGGLLHFGYDFVLGFLNPAV